MLRFFSKAPKIIPSQVKNVLKDSMSIVVSVLIAKTGTKLFSFSNEFFETKNKKKDDNLSFGPKN